MKKSLLAGIMFVCTTFNLRAQDTLRYSKQQVIADIHYFFENAEEIHPNLYHAIPKAQLTKKVDSLITTLPDSLSDLMVFKIFATATAFVNEGHTSINTPKNIRAQRKASILKVIPLEVKDYDRKYFTGNLVAPNANVLDIKVVSVNGKPSNNLFNQMLNLRGGLNSLKKLSAITNFKFYLAVLGVRAPYKIEYIRNNKKHFAEVSGISEDEYAKAIAAPKEDGKSYSLEILNNQYGYMNFRSMAKYNAFTRFCDSVFTVLSQQHINKLIIDLRANGGGDSSLGWYLLNYITDTPFRMAGKSERKVSQQFKNIILANKELYGNGYDSYLQMPNGAFLNMGDISLQKPDDKDYKFRGKVCFLIGPATFSSANMLSATVKDFKLATLIGEPTGETANDYGELCNIKLPNTGILAFTSTTEWVRPNNDKMDNNPIYPDYVVKQTSVKGDDVLKYALKWLD